MKAVATIRIPKLARVLAPSFYWPKRVSGEKVAYLTFDDGPIPEVTPWVLDLLQQYEAKASFFCVGENVLRNRDLFERIIREGHTIGNHTYHHMNGWKTEDRVYFRDVLMADRVINSPFFRPPYGRITRRQAVRLQKRFKLVYWNIVSGDYDPARSPQECVDTVVNQIRNQDILVFHDSLKAWKNLNIALPEVLKQLSAIGYSFRPL